MKATEWNGRKWSGKWWERADEDRSVFEGEKERKHRDLRSEGDREEIRGCSFPFDDRDCQSLLRRGQRF